MDTPEYNDREFRISAHKYLEEFLRMTANPDDDIGSSLKAIIVQFIANFRHQINIVRGEESWVTPIQIIDSQIKELRRCIVDLENYKANAITSNGERLQ